MTTKPFIYLSAGVSNAQFVERSGAGAGEAGIEFAWKCCAVARRGKDGMPIYGKSGVKALEDWLQKDGVANIEAVNRALSVATPWTKTLGVTA